jgi:UDP-glucuronate 4-epimerase
MHYDRSRYDVINLGNSRTVSLIEMISALEEALNKRAELSFEPEQPGDVPVTYADVSKAKELLGYEPKVPFDAGIRNFVSWLRKS